MSHGKYFNPETENWKPERRKQMLSNEDKNEIIEMLRCPTCGGKKRISANGTYYRPCLTCDSTGLILPEKVEEPTINQSDDYIPHIEIYKPEKEEEKSCGNCKDSLTGVESSPCLECQSEDAYKYRNWQPKEQTEDVIQLKFKINQLENSLSEKDKEIAELKIQATSLSAQFERAEMFRVENEVKDKEIVELKEKLELCNNKDLAEKFIAERLLHEEAEAKLFKVIKKVEAERDKYERADLLVYLRDDFECVDFPEIINAIEMFDAVIKVESITKEALGEG